MQFLNSICLFTENVPKLAEFYQKVLQIKFDINEVHTEFNIEGGGITLYSKYAAEKDMGFSFTKFYGTGMFKVTFIVKDIDAEFQRLKSLDMGIEFITNPTTYPWGSRSFHFRDSDGNIVCFLNQE